MASRVSIGLAGSTASEATVVRWLKQEGDEVRQREPLVEVLTDKVSIVLDSPGDGVLLEIVAPAGAAITATSTLCWIGQPGEVVGQDIPPALDTAPVGQIATASWKHHVLASPAAKMVAREHGIDLDQVAASRPDGTILKNDVLQFVESNMLQRPGARPAKASPVAKKLAEQGNLDLGSIRGSGYGGRITKDDVLLAAEQRKATSAVDTADLVSTTGTPASTSGMDTVVSALPLVGIRRTIAQRMAESARTVARVTLNTEVDMTESMKIFQQVSAQSEAVHSVKISYTSVIVLAVARSLRRYPMMNSRLVQDEIHLIDNVNVGVAVAVPEGLVVPVVHHADRKELTAISREIRSKTDLARAGRLSQADVTGGTFTVTNLGNYDIDTFTPIVNLPEVGILGVGRIAEKPAVFQGAVTKRHMMCLSLSFDHRVIDGAPAAEFLRSVKHFLENPFTMFI